MAMSKVKYILGLCLVFLLVSAQKNEAFGSVVMIQDLQMQARQGHMIQGTTPGKLRPQGQPKKKKCEPRCTTRCSATSFKKPFMFFCQKCCAKCLCVPPGTYGNKQTCPCYNNWKTKRGGPKCP